MGPGGAQTISSEAATSRQVALLVLAAAAVRLAVAGLLPVLESEAYYWLWSERLSWGYSDHPPMVAALMWAFGWIAGHGPLGVRLGSVVAATAGAFVFHALARRVVGPRAARAALVFVVVAPLWAPFGIVATPDGPLLLFWTLSLYLFWRAREDGGWGWWLAAGAATGLTILSKYNGFQLPIVFVLFLLLTPQDRARLSTARPWAALAVALLVASPNLAWNAAHGGRTLVTPFQDGIDPSHAAGSLLRYALLPFALLMPWIGYAWLRVGVAGLRAGRHARDDAFRFLVCASFVPFGMFAGVALLTDVHLQWVAPCLIAAVPIAFLPLDEGGRPAERWLRTGTWVAGGVLAVILAVAVGLRQWAVAEREPADPALAAFPGAERVTGLDRAILELRGWDELRARLESEIAGHAAERGRPLFLVSTNYHVIAKTQHLLRGRLLGLPLKASELHNYEVWHGAGEEFVGRDAICVEKRPRPGSISRLHHAFRSVTALPPIAVRVGDATVHRFSLYLCRDFRRYPVDARSVELPPEGDALEEQAGD